jgi:alanine racemase
MVGMTGGEAGVGRPWPGLRPAWAEVDLGAIATNVRRLAAEVAPADVMAVVKADGYGHGAVPVARAALGAGASWLGVALVEEALELRAAGISAPLLVLQEPHHDAADACARHGIAVTVATPQGVSAFAAAGRRAGRAVAAHLKVDTGMHRVGCEPAAVPELARALVEAEGIEAEGLLTHFAVADDPEQEATTKAQLSAYHAALKAAEDAGLSPRLRHVANSAGATLRDDARFDLVRLGIAIYGLSPDPRWSEHTRARLRPAMSVRAAVSAVRTVEAGAKVSYAHAWTAPRRTRIATLPIGYADGVRRGLSGRLRAVIGGISYQQVGRITMDQLMLDVGDGAVEVGSVAILLGDPAHGEPGASDWAAELDTIDYEITCGLGTRLPRVYHGS